LDTCVFAYNISKHDSSKFTPFELLFAQKAVLLVGINAEMILDDLNEAKYV